MIQRIQTLFFSLAILVNVSSLFLPLWSGGLEENTQTIRGLSIQQGAAAPMFFEHESTGMLVAHSAFVALCLLSVLWLIRVVFLYQHRLRQISSSYIALLLICVQILALVWLTLQSPSLEAGPEAGGIAPVLALVFTWLAVRAVRKDEDLVRSVDRIR